MLCQIYDCHASKIMKVLIQLAYFTYPYYIAIKYSYL
jgi:hypothetical protein